MKIICNFSSFSAFLLLAIATSSLARVVFKRTRSSFSSNEENRVNPNGKAAARGEGKIWAVLVAGSSGWWNYRHQADICHAWHTLVTHGVDPENIVTMMYDDIAYNKENPFQGKLFNHPQGQDVYSGVRIDYKGDDVNPANFMSVLLGDEEATDGKRVLKSTNADKVFVYFTDHGASGLIGFPDDILSVKNLTDTLNEMHKKGIYKELTFYLEACESGSMFDRHMPENLEIYAVTAANGRESSWGCYCETKLLPGNCLGDLFSVNWMEDSDKENLLKETLRRQLGIVIRKTNMSHVQSFGNRKIEQELVAEFMGSKEPNKTTKNWPQYKPRDFPMYSSRDIPLVFLAKQASGNNDAGGALQTLQKKRRFLEKQISQLAKKLLPDTNSRFRALTVYPEQITQLECHHRVVHTFNRECFNFAQNPYAMKYAFVLANFCELGIDAAHIEAVMTLHCSDARVSAIRGIL